MEFILKMWTKVHKLKMKTKLTITCENRTHSQICQVSENCPSSQLFSDSNRRICSYETRAGWWLKTKPWLLAFEWLYSCQEETLLLRIQRTKEGILEATAVEQTDIPLSLIQPGQVRNPFAPTSRRMKRRQLICLCSNLNKIKTLKTIWWGLTSHPARSPSKGKRLGCSPFPNKSCFLSSSDGFPKTNNGTQNQKRAVLFYVAENKYLYKQQPTLPSVSGNVQAETGQVSMNYIYQSLRLNFLDIQSRG